MSWWLLLHPSGTHPDWLYLLQNTWVALGLTGMKIAAVRSSSPLPAERTEEHNQYQDKERRNRIRMLSAWSWSVVVILLGNALRHAWYPTEAVPRLQWLFVAVFLAIYGYMMFVVFRNMRLATNAGRDLLPPGSFATPFRCASLMWTG